MNPLTKVKLINELNEREAKLGVRESVSWHQDYKDSAWIFMGGLPYELTEGDIICVFSQYGEVVNINLVRDKSTGRSRGFCFLCFEDQRSTVLAVDNLNGIKLKGRTIRVDHVSNYRPPKDSDDIDDVTKALRDKGCGARTPSASSSEEELVEIQKTEKEKKKKRKKRKHHSNERDKARDTETIKQERDDPGYEKYNIKQVGSRPETDRQSTLEKETSSRSVSKPGQSTSDRIRLTEVQKRQPQENKQCEPDVKRGKDHDKKRR